MWVLTRPERARRRRGRLGAVHRRRILLEDARGADRHLRVTWHPEAGQFNVSTWHGDVCAGAVRVRAEDAPRLIALLAEGMGDALVVGDEPTGPTGPTAPPPRWRIWLERARRRGAA